jgi:hypothetical protein
VSESKELVVVQQQEMSLRDTLELGNVLAQSGYFSDARQKAQAVVKILAGREYGFGPIASMTGIHLVNGKITLGADMLAKAVKRHPHYDYQVIKLEADECILEFFRDGKRLGTSSLTMQQARDAKMNQSWDKQKSAWKEKIPWKNFPRNMLFARCISNGVKWFCPDAVGAVTYTPDEMGAETDERGEMIDVTPTPAPQSAASTPPTQNGNGGATTHWIDGQTASGKTVKAAFWAWTGDLALTNDDVHEALEVESVRDYTGTMGDAKTKILAWVDEMQKVGDEEMVHGPDMPEGDDG